MTFVTTLPFNLQAKLSSDLTLLGGHIQHTCGENEEIGEGGDPGLVGEHPQELGKGPSMMFPHK